MKLRVAAVCIGIALAVAGCSSADGSSPSPRPSGLNDQIGATGPYQGAGVVPAQPRPQFVLTDTAGKPYSFGQQTQGRATLLFFGYTRCPDVCPATMSDIGVALRQQPKSVQQKVTVVFVTTDVKHDTGAVITQWMSHFSPNTHATFVGLRGTQAQIDAAQAASHIMLASDDGQTHSSEVLFYGPDDYAHDSFIYNNANEQKQMAHDIPIVVNS